MTRRSAAAYLWDLRNASQLAMSFADGKSLRDYQTDALLQSAIERQMITIGEALRGAIEQDQSLISHFTDVRKIIAFRNHVVHKYFDVDDATVWDVIINHLPGVVEIVNVLLADDPLAAEANE